MGVTDEGRVVWLARRRAGQLRDNGKWRGLPPQHGSYRPPCPGNDCFGDSQEKGGQVGVDLPFQRGT